MLTGTGALAESALATGVIVFGNTLLRPVAKLMNYRMATDTYSLLRRVRVRFRHPLADEVHGALRAFSDHRAVAVRRSIDAQLDATHGMVEFDVELDGREGEVALNALNDRLRGLGADRVEMERIG
jgi:hypothetical protein